MRSNLGSTAYSTRGDSEWHFIGFNFVKRRGRDGRGDISVANAFTINPISALRVPRKARELLRVRKNQTNVIKRMER